MKNSVLIFGNNYFAELMGEYIEEFSDRTVAAYIVNKDYITDKHISGKPVIAYEEFENHFGVDDVEVIVTSGYKGMNDLRRRICIDIKKKGYGLYTFIHPKSLVYADEIGDGNIILEGVVLSKHVRIGTGNIIWNGVNISHHATIGNYNFIAPSAVIGGRCNISNNCFMGLNSTVKGGVKVGDYTLVGAGAYLGNDSLDCDVYVPGRRERLKGKSSLEIL